MSGCFLLVSQFRASVVIHRLPRLGRFWQPSLLKERHDYRRISPIGLGSIATRSSIIPADDKWYARAAVADIIAGHLDALDLAYPKVSPEDEVKFAVLAKQLEEQA